MKQYKFQLYDRPLGGLMAGPAIIGAGGQFLVCNAGSQLKSTLLNKDGTSLAQPVALTRGAGAFWIANSVESVDIFIQTPDNQFVALYDVKPDALGDVPVDRSRVDQTMIIPFHFTNQPATVETDTGFDINLTMVVQPNPVVQVVTLDAGITIGAGVDGAGLNVALGYVSGVSVAAAGLVKATLTNGAATLGSLLRVQDSANAGDLVPEQSIETAAENVTITLSAGADTATGYLHIPYKNYTRSQPTI